MTALSLHLKSGPPDSGKVEKKVTVCIQNEETLEAGKNLLSSVTDRSYLLYCNSYLETVTCFIGILICKATRASRCVSTVKGITTW